MSRQYSTALPIAYVTLRILIVVNILVGIGIAALLFALPHEQWLMISLKLKPSADTTRLVWGMRGVAALGLLAIPLNHMILTRLVEIVKAVRRGEAFVAINAWRLHVIAWVLLVLQVIGIVIGGIGRLISSPAHPVRLDAGFSPAGWLAVLLIFVLARVFAEGTRMRDDLDGTV